MENQALIPLTTSTQNGAVPFLVKMELHPRSGKEWEPLPLQTNAFAAEFPE